MTLLDDQFRCDPQLWGPDYEEPLSSTRPASGPLLSPNELLPTVRSIADTIMALPDQQAIDTINEIEHIMLATSARILARADDGTGHQAENLAGSDGKTSKKKRKKAGKRAKSIKNNPDLADDIETGEVSDEQFDDLADADHQTDGAASQDAELMEKVKSSNSDQSKKDIQDFVDEHNQQDDETKHDKQRRLRNVNRFNSKRGTDAIMGEGDTATMNLIWDLIEQRGNEYYHQDGGRDTLPKDHRRTRAQRMFDAFVSFFLNPNDSDSGPGKTSRATILLSAHLNDDGTAGGFNIPGSGPIPAGVFDKYYCNADLIGILFDGNGQPLWHGKKIRTATKAQLNALYLRDNGCVLCKARPALCEAHHLLPWSAPGSGKTDIDNLALVCPGCHHMIHDTKQTLHKPGKIWKLRPALPHEIPPPKPKVPKRE